MRGCNATGEIVVRKVNAAESGKNEHVVDLVHDHASPLGGVDGKICVFVWVRSGTRHSRVQDDACHPVLAHHALYCC